MADKLGSRRRDLLAIMNVMPEVYYGSKSADEWDKVASCPAITKNNSAAEGRDKTEGANEPARFILYKLYIYCVDHPFT